MESRCHGSAGMKNVGRRQAHQIAPRMRAAASEAAPPELLAQRAGIGDEGEGQKGVEPGGGQIQCGETDEDGGVPRQRGPARNGAGKQAADTGPAATGACRHDDAVRSSYSDEVVGVVRPRPTKATETLVPRRKSRPGAEKRPWGGGGGNQKAPRSHFSRDNNSRPI